MYGYEVKIIEDSIFLGSRLITYSLKYPRFVHAELMTHRVFSRNASSSRAIPVKKTLEMLRTCPAMPIHWGENQKGMQAQNEVQDDIKKAGMDLWLLAAKNAATIAEEMEALKLHKQVVNRILEPFTFISVVVTSTDYQNFFNLRSHPDAQPEIRYLSDLMKEAYETNVPKELKEGEYHLPYILPEERAAEKDNAKLASISSARCARVSYLTHEKLVPKPEEDIDLFYRLVGGNPIHASPTEHQARPARNPENNNMNGNFHYNWCQFRKYIEQKKVLSF